MPGLLRSLWSWLTGKPDAPPGPPPTARKSFGEEKLSRTMFGSSGIGHMGLWSHDRGQQALHLRGWVYVAVKAIYEEMAGTPPQVALVHTKDEAHTLRQKAFASGLPSPFLSPFLKKKAMAQVQAHEELEPVDSQHPLARLLANPNGPDTSWLFFASQSLFQELHGISYIWCCPNSYGIPVELWCLPPQWIFPLRGKDKLIDRYQVRPYGQGGAGTVEFPERELITIRTPSPLSMWDGWSPLQAGAEWIDIAESVDMSRWASMKNDGMPAAAITLGTAEDGYSDPDQPTIDAIYAKWAERFGGERNRGKPVILGPGMDVKSLSTSGRDMDYVGSAEQLRDMVLALFRVPKSMVGIVEDSTYASAVAAALNFRWRTISPKRALLGQTLTEKLAKRFDSRLVIFWEGSGPEDPAQTNADLQQDYTAGIITPNEYRIRRGLAPYEHGGDDPIVAGQEKNWATGKKPEPPPAAPGGPPGQPGQPQPPESPGEPPDGDTAGDEDDAPKSPGGPPAAPKGSGKDTRTKPQRDQQSAA